MEVVSVPDRGIYDAMNKGVARCKGIYIGVLNADDAYADEQVLSQVLATFEHTNADVVYGSARVVDGEQEIRVCDPGKELFLAGRLVKQIPHPALFIRKACLDRVAGPFDESLAISADLKLLLHLIQFPDVRLSYIPNILVTIKEGGLSTSSYKNRLLGWREAASAYNQVCGNGGWGFVAAKLAFKCLSMIKHKLP